MSITDTLNYSNITVTCTADSITDTLNYSNITFPCTADSITDTLNYSNITVTCTPDNLAYPEYGEAIGNTGGAILMCTLNYCTGVL